MTSGKFVRHMVGGKPTDVCAFSYAGKQLMVGVAGRPELVAALAAEKIAEKQARDDKQAAMERAVPGLAAYEAASAAAGNARGAYDQASERGYPAREAAAAEEADTKLQAVYAQYPATALWAKIEAYIDASNYLKSAAGNAARKAVEAGADIASVVAKMQADWSAAAGRAVDNS